MKVFLGGTCNNSTWRQQLIPLLEQNEIEYFNPVVVDWTPACQAEELKQRATCDIVLYTITPDMTGVYSIAEVVDDSNKRPEKTMLCVLDEHREFHPHVTKSLAAVSQLVFSNGGSVCTSLKEIVEVVKWQEQMDDF